RHRGQQAGIEASKPASRPASRHRGQQAGIEASKPASRPASRHRDKNDRIKTRHRKIALSDKHIVSSRNKHNHEQEKNNREQPT
ncbi:hypothetical protein, partial [Thiolapillus sp.]|uniref:hypothetical protein n=1 Tax=Thiolapillus sp. TaxID=2017437 RepID=UPI003AF8128E